MDHTLPTERKRVFVGLSGGVDSALSAALLKEQGYDVTGVFIETWHPDFLPCTWKDDRREAMRVAAFLEIPFISLDLSEKYRTEVGEYFIEEYRQGRTPNPDVMCNRSIKFGGFADFARESGADYMATGHYAQIIKKNDFLYLKKGKDDTKDQSYFLWMLNERDLAFALFPIGHLTKDNVRKEAMKRGLPNAERKDSQGICFLGAIDLLQFLSHFIDIKQGVVLDQKGNTIGVHKGAAVYTRGERHGFTVTDPELRTEALYVQSTNIAENTIVVGHEMSIPTYLSYELKEVNETPLLLSEGTEASVRYHGRPIPCHIKKEGEVFVVQFKEPISVANGQSVVVYKEDLLVGAGIVDKPVTE